MTETEQAAHDLGVFTAHRDDLGIFTTMSRAVDATVAKLTETRQENMRLRAHRWSWFLAALAGWTTALIGWWAFLWITKI